MKIEILGSGSAFAKNTTNSSVLLWLEKDNAVLFDCGFNVFPVILEKEYAKFINTILLSHTHQDHCGSAVALLEYRHNILKQKTFVCGVSWEKLLRLCDGNDAFDMVVQAKKGLKIETMEVPHAKGMDCKALFVEEALLYSGDTSLSLLDSPFAQKAKIIIHDVHKSGNSGHVGLDELGKATLEMKAKTYLTHYAPQDYDFLEDKARKLGFAGLVKPGMKIEL